MTFILLAGLLVVIALFLLLPPLLKGSRRPQPESTIQATAALNVLREQLADLEKEHASGSIDEAAYTQSREELERRALEEGIADSPQPHHARQPARHWAAALILFVPITAVAVYLILGNPDGLDSQKTATPSQPNAEQIAGMVDKLVEKLKQEPNNVEGWIMLIRSYQVLGDYAKASAAFAQLAPLLPDNADMYADWAETVMAQKGGINSEAEELALKALTLDPDNLKALTFAGGAAFERGQYAQASAYWERILTQIPPEEKEMAASILAGINEARAKGGLPALSRSTVKSADSTQSTDSPLRLTGRISIRSAFMQKVTPDDTVFIFVRGSNTHAGPPLAALRFKVSELPRDFSFAEVPLMMGNSTVPETVTLAARISKSDKITAIQSGDLEGSLENIRPDAQGLTLEINQVHP